MLSVVRNRWVVFAAAIAMVAVASLAVVAVRARSNGCIFDDGAAYCAMAKGKLATPPFNRRVVVPAVASWLPSGWSIVFRFQLLALVTAAGATLATGLLTLRLLRDRATPRVAYPAALAAAALVALAPHLFRMALVTPVVVDQAAIFLGLVWCLLATARAPSLTWLSPLIALLLIPTREAWALPLLLAAGVLWWMRRRGLAVATVMATVVAAAFTFTRPNSGVGPWARFSSTMQVLHDGRLTLIHPDHALWAVFFGVGFAVFFALPLLPRLQELRSPVGIVLAIAFGQLVQAPLGGTDVARYAAEALPFGFVLAIVAVVELGTSRAFWGLVTLTAATLVLWQPFTVPALGEKAYVSMYTPGPNSALIALSGLLLIAATLIWVLRRAGPMAESGARVTPQP